MSFIASKSDNTTLAAGTCWSSLRSQPRTLYPRQWQGPNCTLDHRPGQWPLLEMESGWGQGEFRVQLGSPVFLRPTTRVPQAPGSPATSSPPLLAPPLHGSLLCSAKTGKHLGKGKDQLWRKLLPASWSLATHQLCNTERWASLHVSCPTCKVKVGMSIGDDCETLGSKRCPH